MVVKDNKIARTTHLPDKRRYALCTEAKKSVEKESHFRSIFLTLPYCL
jgi:hypothetical protein